MRPKPYLRRAAMMGAGLGLVGLMTVILLTDTTSRLYSHRRAGSPGPFPLNVLEVSVLVCAMLMMTFGPFLIAPWLRANASEGWASVGMILLPLYFFPIMSLALYFFYQLLLG